MKIMRFPIYRIFPEKGENESFDGLMKFIIPFPSVEALRKISPTFDILPATL